MDRIAVRSKDIALVGYEAETSTLEVAFRSGGVYQYTGVSQETRDAFLKAPSLGIFFADHIKDQYPYTKIH